jgi:16S rRNA (adenine1518-N6/adenine1519-N6)-dimethyltransferase
MAQTKHQIQAILSEAAATPKQRFGQNFMIDANLVRIIADSGQIAEGELVIEVGPGTGTLTEELMARGATLLAVEIDRALAEKFQERFGSDGNVSLIAGDALDGKHALNSRLLEEIRKAKSLGKVVKLVANLPYNIASPLIIEMLIAGVDLLAFTVQKEVADRLRAGPGSKEYGTLSIMVQLLAEVEVIRTLPKQSFWPMPKIESSLVRLMRNDRLGAKAAEFGTFVRQIFSARRKTLRNALAPTGAEELPESLGIDPKLRPEELAAADYLRLFNARSDQ